MTKKFTLRITETDNDAFSDGNMQAEIGRILEKLGKALQDGDKRATKLHQNLFDYNGNAVGAYLLKEDDK